MSKLPPEQMIGVRRIRGATHLVAAARDLDPFESDASRVDRIAVAFQILKGEEPSAIHPHDLSEIQRMVAADAKGKLTGDRW